MTVPTIDAEKFDESELVTARLRGHLTAIAVNETEDPEELRAIARRALASDEMAANKSASTTERAAPLASSGSSEQTQDGGLA